jgi:hypothetical protein
MSVSEKAIRIFESGELRPSLDLDRVRVALESAGVIFVEFIAQNGGRAGVRLRNWLEERGVDEHRFRPGLDEMVRIDVRDISLNRAVRKYVEFKKQLAGRTMAPTIWHRDRGKVPSFFDLHHMDALAASIPAEDLNASNDG